MKRSCQFCATPESHHHPLKEFRDGRLLCFQCATHLESKLAKEQEPSNLRLGGYGETWTPTNKPRRSRGSPH